jgi:hypothetical protein
MSARDVLQAYTDRITAKAAACIYRFNWDITVDGKRDSGSGRGTTALKRVGDRWWIVHEHLSRWPG